MAVHFAQFMFRRRLDEKFCVLGDDYLTGDEELAEYYLSLLEKLGVKVSVKKTFRAPRLCEFAKRLLFRADDGQYVELSPFPVSAIWNTEASAPLLVATLHGETKKELVARSGIPGAIKDLDRRLFPFYGPLFGISPKRARIRGRAARHADAIMRLVLGDMTAEDCVTTILDGLCTKEQVTPESALSLLRRACALLYRRSMGAADRPQASAHFALEICKLVLAPFDCAAQTVDPNAPFSLGDLHPPIPIAGVELKVRHLREASKDLACVPILAIYARLENGMAADLFKLGDGTGPLEN
jgi:hypothetical protein